MYVVVTEASGLRSSGEPLKHRGMSGGVRKREVVWNYLI